jgi:uncharacterized membrane protein YbaN (DUF454 family)
VSIRKMFWLVLGFLSLGMAYIGVVVPGIPFSIFLVFAAYCFAKSSKRMHDWLYNHKYFGPFLTNWVQKRVFPTKGKYAMILVMSSSLAFLWFSTGNIKAVLWSGGFMALVAIWAWRYPGTVQEHGDRLAQGKKIGWIK